MSDSSWIDHIPSHEQQRLRRRMRSPEAYEKLREKVKGPEDLEKEMDRNEEMAELKFALESESQVQNALKKQIELDIKEKGIDEVFEAADKKLKQQIEKGKYKLTISAHPSTQQDQLVAIPEGNVQEKIPLTMTFNDGYVSQFMQRWNLNIKFIQ